jgi:multiple sugar transport system substrate-binding protein
VKGRPDVKRRILILVPLLLGVTIAGLTAGSVGARPKSGPVQVLLWHGYTDYEGRAIKNAVATFNRTHPKIHVTAQFSAANDYSLQKLLTAIAGGKYPDISYLFGSWAANIAKSPKTLDLTRLVKQPSFHYNDLWPAERAVGRVSGKVVAVPALIDNLALVYNKKLFRQAHITFPTAKWTWADMERAAKKLTNRSKKQFGWAYINDGSEDTVWRFEALLWQAGGNILTPDGKHAAFNSAAGVRALTFLQRMAVKDRAVYLDSGNGNYANVFNSGRIGMLYTGPWDLASFPNVNYGVQILPGDKNHQTIAGPDNWVLFNNGAQRSAAAWTFMKWFLSTKEHVKIAIATGELPIRKSELKQPGYKRYVKKYKGIGTFVQNLGNAKKARPVTEKYPRISQAIGQAVQAVLLGKAQPKAALDQAAGQVNSILGTP